MKKWREQRLILDAVMLGALGAQLFTFLLHLAERFLLQGIACYTPPGLPDEGGVLRQVIGPRSLVDRPLNDPRWALSGGLVYPSPPRRKGTEPTPHLISQKTFSRAQWDLSFVTSFDPVLLL